MIAIGLIIVIFIGFVIGEVLFWDSNILKDGRWGEFIKIFIGTTLFFGIPIALILAIAATSHCK